ncbi:hypothetical protein BDZ94DRAFT_1256399 [Collybia nuda]|uniref:Uncharacterized protein n=1 Tax=Collybia nuda TaxID=64659 RepID=A0A9P6CFR4_9AGAR|nr:hypothetical protein BDZ94DRAFT_1256399 [Collybia nuda]
MSSIPTPPFSPKSEFEEPEMSMADHPLKSTINLLDALVSFYQYERVWVCRTRAALDNALQDSPMADVETTLPSPTSETDTPLEDETENETESSHGTPSFSSTKPSSRWLRRKRGFKLNLESVGRHRRVSTLKSLNSNPPYRDNILQREQILEMFEKMMEDRLESCQRIHRLVRNANRVDLHHR